jgi:hypothetical protein
MAAAIGLRTALSVQANRAGPAAPRHWAPASRQPFRCSTQMQREQPPRRIEIDIDLALEAFAQQRRAFVVQAAAAHVERFDLRRRRIADRLEIAFADEEIILDHAANGVSDSMMRPCASSLSRRMSKTSRFSSMPSTSL